MADPSEVLGANNMLRSLPSICSHILAREKHTYTQMQAGTHKRTHTPDLEVTSQQRSLAEEDFFCVFPENVLPPP